MFAFGGGKPRTRKLEELLLKELRGGIAALADGEERASSVLDCLRTRAKHPELRAILEADAAVLSRTKSRVEAYLHAADGGRVSRVNEGISEWILRHEGLLLLEASGFEHDSILADLFVDLVRARAQGARRLQSWARLLGEPAVDDLLVPFMSALDAAIARASAFRHEAAAFSAQTSRAHV